MRRFFRQIPSILATVLLTGILALESLIAQTPESLQLSGNVQVLPIWIHTDVPPPVNRDSFLEYRLQNRLNLQWDPTPDLTFHWQMRTRMFAGDLVEHIPQYAELIDQDNGLVNLSWMPVRTNHVLLHYLPDRLYTEWRNSDWTVRLGRQRINWGINTVTNPNDLFNIYSFYDFDYPERPGSDAIRIQRYVGVDSRWELAASPARSFEQSTIALLYGFNRSGYDIQLISGYYRERIVFGGGWAGYIGQSGFKGEVMLFTPQTGDRPEARNTTDLVFGLSIDHMFPSSLYLIVEGLYNRAGGQESFILQSAAFTANNPSLSRFQITTQASYTFSPIFNGSLAVIWYPDEKGFFLSPSITQSLHQDIDLTILAQIFTGDSNSPLSGAGQVLAGSLTWNF